MGKRPPKGKLWDRYQGRKRSLKKLTSYTNPRNLAKKFRDLEEKENDIPDGTVAYNFLKQ